MAEKLVKIGTRLPTRLVKRLKAYAKENQTSAESVIADALKDHFDRPPRILLQGR